MIEKYTEFTFIQNALCQKNYTKELENYIDEVTQIFNKGSKLKYITKE